MPAAGSRVDSLKMQQWSEGIPDDQWEIYERVMRMMNERRIAFALGGAFSLASYSHHWRNTRDLDLYILPESLRELIEHAGSAGVEIMIENLPGDYNSAPQLGELLDPLPEIGLHLDIGHANLIAPHNTLEVFSPGRRHFEFSRDLLRKLGDEIDVEAETVDSAGDTQGAGK